MLNVTNKPPYAECCFAEFSYTECRYAEYKYKARAERAGNGKHPSQGTLTEEEGSVQLTSLLR
jgi:hypothetical protein